VKLALKKNNIMSSVVFCSSAPGVIGVMRAKWVRWTGHVARMVAVKVAYEILVRRPEEKRPLRRPGRRWEADIRMGLRELIWECVD
jgi:hypothetical protein